MSQLTRTRIAAALVVAASAVAGYLAATGRPNPLAAAPDAKEAAKSASPPPGSPAATTTIDGKQLPPAPAKFGGKIERVAAKSEPYWPPKVTPKKGAPNVLLIMTDDSGFGVTSTFGGVIPTPALDRVAG